MLLYLATHSFSASASSPWQRGSRSLRTRSAPVAACARREGAAAMGEAMVALAAMTAETGVAREAVEAGAGSRLHGGGDLRPRLEELVQLLAAPNEASRLLVGHHRGDACPAAHGGGPREQQRRRAQMEAARPGSEPSACGPPMTGRERQMPADSPMSPTNWCSCSVCVSLPPCETSAPPRTMRKSAVPTPTITTCAQQSRPKRSCWSGVGATARHTVGALASLLQGCPLAQRRPRARVEQLGELDLPQPVRREDGAPQLERLRRQLLCLPPLRKDRVDVPRVDRDEDALPAKRQPERLTDRVEKGEDERREPGAHRDHPQVEDVRVEEGSARKHEACVAKDLGQRYLPASGQRPLVAHNVAESLEGQCSAGGSGGREEPWRRGEEWHTSGQPQQGAGRRGKP